MKKLLSIFVLALGLGLVAASSAYAVVPSIDGSATSFAGEWDNVGYPYYLEVFDINETLLNNPDGNVPDAYDIKRAVVLQNLDGVGGDPDGIYILFEVYGLNPTMEDLDGSGLTAVEVLMEADFDGDGSTDLAVNHQVGLLFPLFPGLGHVTDGSGQHVDVVNFDFPFASGDLVAGGGSFSVVNGGKGLTGDGSGTCGTAFPGCTLHTAIEYFIPSGTFGTPPIPFPFSFIGTVRYDNGGLAADDVVSGSLSLIPEPSTMLLLGSGLLGVLGFRKEK